MEKGQGTPGCRSSVLSGAGDASSDDDDPSTTVLRESAASSSTLQVTAAPPRVEANSNRVGSICQRPWLAAARTSLVGDYAAAPGSLLPWDEIEDALAILLNNNPDSLRLFQSVHGMGVSEPDLLLHLAILTTSLDEEEPDSEKPSAAACDGQNHHRRNLSCRYADAVLGLAAYLAQPSHRWLQKLAAVRLVVTLRTPLEAGWQLSEDVLGDTLHFILGGKNNRNNKAIDETETTVPKGQQQQPSCLEQHSDLPLLWELRAICRFEQDRLLRERLERIQGATASACRGISRSAQCVETSVLCSSKKMAMGIDQAGTVLKRVVPPLPQASKRRARRRRNKDLPWRPAPPSSPTAEEAVTLAVTANRATACARDSTTACVHVVRSTTSRGLQAASQKWTASNVGETLVPDPCHRSLLTAAGRVSMTSLGATALVADAVYQGTSQVAQHTAAVTADVVEHRYGTTTGEMVRQAAMTTGNVFRTMEQVAKLDGVVLTKAWAKDTGKMMVTGEDGVDKTAAAARGKVQERGSIVEDFQSLELNGKQSRRGSMTESSSESEGLSDYSADFVRAMEPCPEAASALHLDASRTLRIPAKRFHNKQDDVESSSSVISLTI